MICSLVSVYFNKNLAINLAYNKNKLDKILDYEIEGYSQFWLFREGSGNTFLMNDRNDFLRKFFPVLYFIY